MGQNTNKYNELTSLEAQLGQKGFKYVTTAGPHVPSDGTEYYIILPLLPLEIAEIEYPDGYIHDGTTLVGAVLPALYPFPIRCTSIELAGTISAFLILGR